MYRIAVCDDELEYAQYLERLIRERVRDSYEISVELFQSGNGLIQAMETRNNIELVILDMMMGGLDGYDTALRLRKINDRFVLAFCTGITPPEARFYDLKVLRYIMKNEAETEIAGKLDALLKAMRENRAKRCLTLHGAGKGSLQNFDVDDIVYIEYYRRKTWVYVTESSAAKYGGSPVEARDALEDICILTQKYEFGQPQRSYLINFTNMLRVWRKRVYLLLNKDFAISKKYKQQFDRDMKKYYMGR